MLHNLKIKPEYFSQIESERKRFEVRKNDRNYSEGDTLRLEEYDGEYTGAVIDVEVLQVMSGGQFGIHRDYCIMSIQILSTAFRI